jgi:hypothetical protein
MQALSIIVDAYERCNRLSPGEALNADDAAFGFARLNTLVDKLSAKAPFLFQSVLTEAEQSGPITLGAGVWAAIAPGTEIVSATTNGVPLAPITMRQYNELAAPTATGTPQVYAQDGLSTVYLWPVPVGATIKLQTRIGVATFADQTTEYTMPPGYADALGAALAVRIAPTTLGNVPPHLTAQETASMTAINKYEPAIVDVGSFTHGRQYSPKLF